MCRYQYGCVSWSLLCPGTGFLVVTRENRTMNSCTAPSKALCRIGLFLTTLLMATMTSADCKQDLRGEVYCGAGRCLVDRDGTVWCSRHYEGGAAITLEGQVLCGKGRCAKDKYGKVFCSSEIGGAVLVDSRGRVRCYGQCEPATVDNCESTRADSAISEDN